MGFPAANHNFYNLIGIIRNPCFKLKKPIMKHFYTAVAMLAMSLCASAEDYYSVAVHLTDGTQVKIDLSDKLSAMFNDENFVITGGDADVTVPREQIKSFKFSTDKSAVDAINADAVTPVLSGNLMAFSDLPEGSDIAVFDMSGKLLFSAVAGGSYTLDLSTLAASPVIVKVNNVAYKIATKK